MALRLIRFLRSLIVIAALPALLLPQGCATILSGDRQDVKLKAYPADATITVDGHEATQGNLSLSREQQHYIDVKKDGFEPRRVTLKQSINSMFWVNFVFLTFFWVGMLVDAMTGRMNELEPGNVTVSLDPAKAGSKSQTSLAQTETKPPEVKHTETSGPKVDDPVTAKPAGPSGVVNPSHGSADRPRIGKTMTSGPQRDWVVAVMTVGTAGKTNFDKATLLALTDQVRVFLAERGAKVVDRSQQEAALKGLVDEEKKKSYSACVDSSCQVPLGKALAASHILRSTVAKFGKACATNGELIDLKTEVAVAAGSARTNCAEEDLLYAAESLAEQLVTGSAKNH